MKLKLITDGQLPGAFLIEATTQEEALILRGFCNDKRGIHIANFGGNSGEWTFSMLIQHADESPRMADMVSNSVFNADKENEFGLRVCDCSFSDMIVFPEEFKSANETLLFYRCGYCSRFIPNSRVKARDKALQSVAARAGEDIKTGSLVMLYSDGKYYGFPPRSRD